MKNYPVFGSFGAESGGSVTVDTELSSVSENPVQNKAIAAAITNPNLLINPDFKINQRGQTEYSEASGYCVDGWYRNTAATVIPLESGGISVSYSGEINPSIYQKIENSQFLCGKTVSISVSTNGASYCTTGVLPDDLSANTTYSLFARLDGSTDIPENLTSHIRLQVYNGNFLFVINNITKIDSVKLELGLIATQFIPPDPATELTKCQRYYQIRTTGDVDPIDLRPSMRITPTVTLLDNGNYAYNAEL